MTILKTFKTAAITQIEPSNNFMRSYLLNSSNNKLLIESPNQDYLFINNNAYDYLTFVNDWEAEPTILNNLKISTDSSKRWFVMGRGMTAADNYHWPLYHNLQQSLLMTTRLSMSKNLNPSTLVTGYGAYTPSPTNMEGYFYSLDKSTYYKNAIISKLFLNSNNCLLIDCTTPNILSSNASFKATNFLFAKGNELYNNPYTSSIGKTTATNPDVYNSYIPVAYNETNKKIYCLFEAYTSNVTQSNISVLSQSQLKIFNYDFLNDGTVSLSLQTTTNWGTSSLNQAYITGKDVSLAFSSGSAVQGAFNKYVASTAHGTNHSAYMGKDNNNHLYFLSTFNHMRTTWNVVPTITDFNITVVAVQDNLGGATSQIIFNTDTYRVSPNHRINRTGWYDSKSGSCLTYCNIPSKFENSPLTGENDIYYSYIPAFADTTTAAGGVTLVTTDTTTYFTPILVKWNKSINPFNAGINAITIKDCNIVYDAGDPTKNWFTYANVYNTSTSANIPINSSHVKRNNQCFITKLNNVYYLNHIQCLGYSGSADFGSNNPLKYRIVTYTIGSTSWENLTFHSYSQLNADVLSFLPIDETFFTKIMCLHQDSLCFYSFNSSSGWTLTYKEIGSFRQVTRDQLNRVWAYSVTNDDQLDTNKSSVVVAGSGSNQTDQTATNLTFDVSLHLISESLSNVVSVRFEDNTQNYTGVDINSNVYVSVFDENGARIAANVQLVLEGVNTVFVLQDGSTVYTTNVTTLQASDLAVAIKIKGPGYANVYANVIF